MTNYGSLLVKVIFVVSRQLLVRHVVLATLGFARDACHEGSGVGTSPHGLTVTTWPVVNCYLRAFWGFASRSSRTQGQIIGIFPSPHKQNDSNASPFRSASDLSFSSPG